MNNSNSSYGLRMNSCNMYNNITSSTLSGLLANNMISIFGGSGSNYGIYINYCNKVKIYNNSVLVSSGSTNSRALYQSNTYANTFGEEILNNVFANTAGGYAAYYYYTSSPNYIDYNDYYTSGVNLAYWGGNKTNLAALRLASSRDTNSISVNPTFFSNIDLHTLTPALNNAGIGLSSVLYDIDGESRSLSTPDIGADEYTPPAYDMAVVEWSSPLGGISLNSSVAISIKIANYGISAQSNVPIKYSINGGLSVVVDTIVGPIASGDTVSFTFSTTANFSSFAFYDCLAYTDLGAEQHHINDTIFYRMLACTSYSGVYVLGKGSNATFSSFSDLVYGLSNCGISGPITVYVDSGIYNEQVLFTSITGSSATNTITIASASGNPDDVVLTNNANSTLANYTLKLDGADYFKIKNITIKAMNSQMATVIELINGANFNYFYGNKILAAGLSSNSKCIFDYTTINNYNTYRNNFVNGGAYGFYIRAISSSNRQSGTTIDSNEISNFYSRGITMSNQNDIEVTNNYIHEGKSSLHYGIELLYSTNNVKVLRNKVVLSSISSSMYGMKVDRVNYYQMSGVTGQACIVANNMISIIGGSSSCYGIYASYSNKAMYYNNSVLMTGGSTNSRALYQYNTTSNTIGQSFVNNIFVNNSGGYAAYYNTTAATAVINYNDYYSSGTNLAYWGGNKTSLLALQAASSKDGNSISVNPNFFANDDLHTLAVSMDSSGTPLSVVTIDIDGQTRSLSHPDIGADESNQLANDISITQLLSPFSSPCADSSMQIIVVVSNEGLNSQTAVPISAIVNKPFGVDTVTGIIASIAANSIDTVVIGTINYSQFGFYNIKSFVSLVGDEDLSNDTLISIVEIYAPIAVDYIDKFDSSSHWKLNNMSIGAGHGNLGNGLFHNFYSAEPTGSAAIKRKIGNIPNNARLVFDYQIINTAGGTAKVLNVDSFLFNVSTDCGNTSNAVFVLNSSNHTPTTSWVHKSIDLSAFAGNQLVISFEGHWNSGDYWFNIDNFGIAVIPTADLGVDTSFCSNDSISLSVVNGLDYSFSWYYNGALLSVNTNNFYVSTAGIYVVEVNNLAGTVRDTIVVSQNPIPIVNISGLVSAYCDNEMGVQLIGTPSNGLFTGNGIDSLGFLNPSTTGLGMQIVNYSYTDSLACSAIASDTTFVFSTPVPIVSSDSSICLGDSIVISASEGVSKPGLIFSSYIEGSSSNKAIELFNSSQDTLLLNNYRIAQSNNGSAWASYHIFPLGAKLAPNNVWVMVADQVDITFYDTSNADEVLAYPSLVHFSGNDARGIEVTADGGATWNLIDIIGEQNYNPGIGWSIAGVTNATLNHTLKRKPNIFGGKTNWASIAGSDSISSEYFVYPQNDFSYLGSHSVIAFTYEVPSYLWSIGDTTESILVSPNINTTYTVISSNSNCAVMDSVIIMVNSAPIVNLATDTTIVSSN